MNFSQTGPQRVHPAGEEEARSENRGVREGEPGRPECHHQDAGKGRVRRGRQPKVLLQMHL